MLLRKAWFCIRNLTASMFGKKKSETFQSFEKNVRNVSKFKEINIQKTRIGIHYYLKRHFLNFPSSFEKQNSKLGNSRWSDFAKNLYNLSDFERNVWKRVTIWESPHEKSVVMNHATPRKWHFFVFSLFFKKHDFKSFQSIRVLTKALTTCHVLN